MQLVTAPALPSLTPTAGDEGAGGAGGAGGAEAPPLKVGVVQHRWREDPDELGAVLHAAIGTAADAGARVVFLPELTLSRYPADVRAAEEPDAQAEDLQDGPTFAFAAEAARAYGVHVHASLFRRSRDGAAPGDRRGLNTAILVSPAGELVALTDKLHIPVTAGYYEDTWFRPATPAEPYPVHEVAALDGLRLGMPTCWDQWFPEVARAYALGGAQVLVYPTAIGSEPDCPDVDTQPLLRTVVTGHGITAGTFMVVANRTGDEGTIRFYGSSFVSDPYGRVLVEAPRDEEAVLVAELPLEQRRHWLTLFPFLRTRRPDTYEVLEPPGRPGPPVRRTAVTPTLRMPAETDPQDRVWMAFPTAGYTLGDTAEEAEQARATWSAVAHAVAAFAPVTMVVDPADVPDARRWLSAAVEIVEASLDDAWMRDIGPTFVHRADGSLAAVDWVFNGWGQQDWARWDADARIAAEVAREAGVPRVGSTMVNEGGGIHVDGLGTVLVTETVQRDPERNPGWSRADVEAELARTLGASQAIWLPRGLTRDSERYGTRGHVDIVATFAGPGRVLVHDQRDASHPDHAVSAQIRTTLAAAVDARGEALELVPLPAPATLRDEDGWVDWSYVNHLVVNGGVIACVFDDPHDAEALAVLREAYPGREVVAVDARPLFARGGGIHCITQQQPSALSR